MLAARRAGRGPSEFWSSQLRELGRPEVQAEQFLREGVGGRFHLLRSQGTESLAELDMVEELVRGMHLEEVASHHVESLTGMYGRSELGDGVAVEDDPGWGRAVLTPESRLGRRRRLLMNELDAHLACQISGLRARASDDESSRDALTQRGYVFGHPAALSVVLDLRTQSCLPYWAALASNSARARKTARSEML